MTKTQVIVALVCSFGAVFLMASVFSLAVSLSPVLHDGLGHWAFYLALIAVDVLVARWTIARWLPDAARVPWVALAVGVTVGLLLAPHVEMAVVVAVGLDGLGLWLIPVLYAVDGVVAFSGALVALSIWRRQGWSE